MASPTAAGVVATVHREIQREIADCRDAARRLPNLSDCMIQDEVARRLGEVESHILAALAPAVTDDGTP
jgi:hypothetical protein